MDYKRVLKLHFINKLSSRAIAANVGEGISVNGISCDRIYA